MNSECRCDFNMKHISNLVYWNVSSVLNVTLNSLSNCAASVAFKEEKKKITTSFLVLESLFYLTSSC